MSAQSKIAESQKAHHSIEALDAAIHLILELYLSKCPLASSLSCEKCDLLSRVLTSLEAEAVEVQYGI